MIPPITASPMIAMAALIIPALLLGAIDVAANGVRDDGGAAVREEGETVDVPAAF